MLYTWLAARLGLPRTPVAVLEVSPDLIRLTPELCVDLPRARVPCAPALQFGKRYPGDPHRVTMLDFLPDEMLVGVENLHDFARNRVYLGLKGHESFEPWIERIEKRMTERVLDELIREIPPEWYADDLDSVIRVGEQLLRR